MRQAEKFEAEVVRVYERMEVDHIHPVGPEFQYTHDQMTRSQESRGLRVTDQAMTSRPKTVRAVMPNARGSASSAARTIQLRLKVMEPTTQRASVL